MNTERYCNPNDAGKESESAAVGRRIGKLLDSLETIDWSICSGPILDDCRALASKIRDTMRADGWRITVRRSSDTWQVLPPKGGKE